MFRTASTVPRSAALWALVAALAACGDTTPRSHGEDPSRPRLPNRLVVISPAAAEILESLGASDRIVAVGDFVTRPESLGGLPRVGAYDAPNLERIVELRADLVVTSGALAADPSSRELQRLGVAVLALDTETYEGALRSIEVLGSRLGLEDRAENAVREILAAVDDVARRAATLPKRRVLCVVGRDPLFVAGPGSHLDALIAVAGGANVASDVGTPYARMSLEAVLERRPEVIVEVSDHRPGALRGRTPGPWDAWSFVPAVRDGRVYWVEPERLVIPGMRMAAAAELLARIIHPESFGEASPEQLGAVGTTP